MTPYPFAAETFAKLVNSWEFDGTGDLPGSQMQFGKGSETQKPWREQSGKMTVLEKIYSYFWNDLYFVFFVGLENIDDEKLRLLLFEKG